jgi:hypothetical protein
MNSSVAVAVFFLSFKSSSHLLAPSDALSRYLGPELPKDRHTTFSTYKAPGFAKVVVDAPGPKMRHIDFTFSTVVPWSKALRAVGIDPTHVRMASKLTFFPGGGMNRSRVDLLGAAVGKGWTAAYDETATVNHAKLNALKAQIRAASGPARLQLIRSCDTWQSVLHLSAS